EYDIRNASLDDFTNIVGHTVNYSAYRGIVQGLLERTPKGESVSVANTQYTHPAILPPAQKQETALDEQQDETPKPFVFIIDEINRGEISKIFGELFFSIEPSYRGDKVPVKTQYQNMITDESDPFFKGFYVPENVYIIGTMNDIDRSVESMDFAMRRRFAWQEIKAADNTAMLDDAFKDFSDAEALKDEVVGKMLRLNNAIWNEEQNSGIDGLSPAYHIGGAYFRKLKDYLNENADRDEAYRRLWENHLRGVLFEYLRGTANAAENMRKLKAAYDNN
nr:AAA family ATPase [Prevotella sp.]